MQHALSSSRLFLKSSSTTSSNKRVRSLPPAAGNGAHPIADYRMVATVVADDDDISRFSQPWSTVRSHVQAHWTPAVIRHKFEVRRRRRLYRELQVIASTNKVTLQDPATVATSAATKTSTEDGTSPNRLSKMEVALFAGYFCNMAVLTLSVVTVPAMALEQLQRPHAAAAFVAGVASMAPLGGGVGKLVNGFVCQRLGGRRASYLYLMMSSALCMTMSFTKSLAPIWLLLIGYEFLSSIQWTSICDVLDKNYRQKPQLMARGIALLSLSSTLGALAAKTVGAGLLQATHWRTVCRFGSLAAMVGAAAMYFGVHKEAPRQTVTVAAVGSTEDIVKRQSPLASLKAILGNKLFWMIGIGHSLGHLARGSDRLLGPFLQEVASLSGTIGITGL